MNRWFILALALSASAALAVVVGCWAYRSIQAGDIPTIIGISFWAGFGTAYGMLRKRSA